MDGGHPDPWSAVASGWAESSTTTCTSPPITASSRRAACASQALQLLHEAVQRGELSTREALERHDRMTEVKIRLLGDRVSRSVALQLAQELGASSATACEHLAVTRLQADALIALDPALVGLADGVVPSATLDDLTG